jgi:tryptophan-rich sensory protein
MDRTGGFRWWHGVAILLTANAASAVPVGLLGDFAFYNSLKQPSVAPPGWAFAPIWLVLNVTSLVALSRVANTPLRTRSRLVFLWAEAIGWVLFAAFTTLFFWLQSPTLGAVDTVAGLSVGLVSLVSAVRIDRPAAGLILLRVLWLGLATYVSLFVALSNVDPFFSTPPL